MLVLFSIHPFYFYSYANLLQQGSGMISCDRDSKALQKHIW